MKFLGSLKNKPSGVGTCVSAFAVAAVLTVALPITFPAETGTFAFAQQGGGQGAGAGDDQQAALCAGHTGARDLDRDDW